MSDVITSMLQFFGIAEIPSTMPDLLYWLCSLVAGVYFVKSVLSICFGFVKNVNGGVR